MIIFASGRQINVPNGSLSITRRLEMADYYSRLIFFTEVGVVTDKKPGKVNNIYNLTAEEVIELADAMIHLWIDLKDNVRTLGVENPEIFNTKKGEK